MLISSQYRISSVSCAETAALGTGTLSHSLNPANCSLRAGLALKIKYITTETTSQTELCKDDNFTLNRTVGGLRRVNDMPI